jgi:hypothetical protein
MPTLKFPLVNKKYSEQFSADAMKQAKKAYALYGSIINAASATIGINKHFIVGFMLVENMQLDPDAVSYGCTAAKAAQRACSYGLMQMQVPTAFQTMKDQAHNLKSAEAMIIQKYLPGFLKPAGFVGFLTEWNEKIYQALLKPEFAIWIGTMHLAQLINKTIKDYGSPRLDHVIIKYNRGVGNFNKEVVKPGLSQVDTLTLVSKLPIEETRSYVVKFLGIDGSVIASMRAA